MKTLNQTTLLTGALAGVTSACLSFGANSQSTFAIALYAGSALPVLIAGLGFGNAASIIALIVGGIAAMLLVSPYFALLILVITLGPAAWVAHLANLARPASELGGPEDALAWYPLSGILSHISGLVTLSVIATGVIIGYDNTLSGRMIDMVLETLKAQEPLYDPTPEAVTQIKSVFEIALPLVQGAVWVLMLFGAFYLAVRIVRMSGKTLRPRDDIPSALRMGRNAIFVFLGGLVLIFVGGTPAVIGALLCGTFGAGFILSGFAVMHFRTRGKPWRLPVLWLAYLSVLLFTLPAVFFLVTGLADTRRAIPISPIGKQP